MPVIENKIEVRTTDTTGDDSRANPPATIEDDISNPNFDMFMNTNVQPIQSSDIPVFVPEAEQPREPKFEEILVDQTVPDKYVDDPSQLIDREV